MRTGFRPRGWPVNAARKTALQICARGVVPVVFAARATNRWIATCLIGLVYAPNYWQWFAHWQNHGLLPPEIAHCRTQLDLIRQLGLDVFSRNIYCAQPQTWFGGLATEVCAGIEIREEVRLEGRDRNITRTYPTLGDIELDEAMRLAGDRLILTGGISALETERFKTRDEVRRYVEDRFRRLAPYRHRFMLSASCNTSLRTPWTTLVWFRDAWREFGG